MSRHPEHGKSHPRTRFSFLRAPGVVKSRNTSRSGLYDDINEGLFTTPVHLGPRAVGWPIHEVEVLNAALISGYSDEEIRALVKELIEARKYAVDIAKAGQFDSELNSAVVE